MSSDAPTEPIAMSSGQISTQFLQLVLGAIPVGVVVVDQALVIQAINPAAETITGVTADEAIGRPYTEVLRTHERNIRDPLEEALAERKVYVNQRFFLQHDDPEGLRPIRHSATVLTDEEGNVIGGVTIFADISRQVALERQISGQRRYLNDVLQSMPDGVATLDEDLTIRSWNSSAEAITGRTAAATVGSSCAEVFGPAIGAVLDAHVSGEGDGVSGQQARITTAGGEQLPIGFSAGNIQTPSDGSRPGGIIAFRDISERLQRQRENAEQRRYLRQILEMAPYGIFTVDQDLVIQTFNQPAEALTGVAASFAVGKPYQQVLDIDAEFGTDPLPLMFTAGQRRAIERLRLTDAEGARIPIRYAAATLLDVDDRPTGAIVIFQDISDIVAAERMKNEFISMVSHELRTPLTSIKGFVTAVLDGRAGEINDRQERFLSISREQSNLLLNLINDLLDLTQLETGEFDLSKSRVAVAELLQKSADAIKPLARRKNLTIRTDIPTDLDRQTLWADEDKLFQVLQNLLSNAVKFTPLDGEVTVGAAAADAETISLYVRDTGIGIPKEEQAQIFEPFYQVENIQTRSVGGTGLGLPIVKHIVDAHGGRIALESEPGVGSTFRIELPRVNTPRPKVRTARRALEPTPASGSARGEPRRVPRPAGDATNRRADAKPEAAPARLTPLILVIDDDEATRSLIRFLLEEEGYDVITAQNGPEALPLARKERPNLITLDILMPKMDGFDILERLKDNPATAEIPVCIVSIIEDKVKGYRLGAIDYITKPFEAEQLTEAIRSVLDPAPSEADLTILVVEDDPHILELIELALAGEAYRLITASDGVSALERLRRDQPQLVLLDIMLPKLDGYEFIRQAKANGRTQDIPILVLSVRSLEEDINRALRLGAEKYLIKPPGSTDNDLTQVVGEAIQEFLDNETRDE
jgi:PAS domain S-box-containing protein